MDSHCTLSAVIITKNEERNIGRCLESLKDVADEIVVIDSHSTDGTPEICARYQVRFITSDWQGYATTKNYGNSLATGDYILSVDADEALSDELKNSIVNFKSGTSKPDACKFSRLTRFCSKWMYHCGWYPDRKLRLWKNGIVNWEGTIHEKPVLTESGNVALLKGDLLHYSYYSINEYLAQMTKYTDLVAEENFRRGKRIGLAKMVLSPLTRFFTSYIIRRGFQDGFYGLVVCTLSSVSTFLKYAKTRQLYLEAKKN